MDMTDVMRSVCLVAAYYEEKQTVYARGTAYSTGNTGDIDKTSNALKKIKKEINSLENAIKIATNDTILTRVKAYSKNRAEDEYAQYCEYKMSTK